MRSKFKWIFTLLVAFLVQFSFAQEKTVTGIVSDAIGPLAGANVVVQGTMNGATTNFDGAYSIKANQGDVLVFTYTGMVTTTSVVGTSNVVNSIMQEAILKGGEVVVTGALGIKREEKAVTYAAQSIQGESMTEARESNLVNALSGKIAGVQVTNSSGVSGASSRIVLRGNSSITGNNQALFVVDGVPFDNTTNGSVTSTGGVDVPNGAASINPDDIESVTVLKGPTAAALYGIRASNGVILITTKSGKGKDKFEVSFNTNTTFANTLLLPSYQNSYGQGQTSDYFEFGNGSDTGTGYNDVEDSSWGPALDKGLSFIQWDSFKHGGQPTPWVSHPDNVKDFFQTGITQANTLSLISGGENGGMRLSIGNSNEKGMVPFSEYKKFNVGFNGDMKLGKKLTAGANLTYYNDKSDNLVSQGYDDQNVVSQLVWSARNVNFPDLKDWRSFPLTSNGTPLNWNQQYNSNPYWILENNRATYAKDRFTGSVNLNFKFTEALSVKGTLMMDYYSQKQTERKEQGTINAVDGYYQDVNRTYQEINAQTILSYAKKISDDFSVTLNGGMNTLKRQRTLDYGQLSGGLQLPGLFSLSNAKSGTTPVIDSNVYNQRINSVLGFGQLSYKNYVFVDFSGRNDWSSLLSTKNNSFFYPSVSGSIVLSDMLGFNDSKLNYVKLRGGWSKVGGTGALDEYSLNKTFTLANGGFGSQANVPNTQWNPDLKPETTTGIEVGLDITGFNNRLRFAATYYDQLSKDLILKVNTDASSGFSSSWENAGQMSNKGIELQLGATVLKSDNFSFDVDLNFAKNKNLVEKLDGVDRYRLGGNGFDGQLMAIPGEAYGAFYGHGYQRDNDGNVIYANGLPQRDPNLKILGNITPDWTGGALFSLKYKGFSLNTLVDAKMGGDVLSMTYLWGRYAGTLEESLVGRETGVVGNGVVSDGSGGYVPNTTVVPAKTFNEAAYSASGISEGGIFDASYVKLRQIVFGYSLPKKWLNGTFIQDFKVSVVGRNLAILYKKVPHIDPETGFGNSNGGQGFEYGQLPSARTYGFNINVKF